MASQLEREYIDLLHPEKDPVKAFSVDVAELLSNFITSLRNGDTPINFTSAAILLQAGSSLYGRKVEFLYNLAATLHDSLMMKPKDRGDPNKANPKERAARKGKLYDPFCSTDIKPGKNLSCLRRKITVKKPTASKRPPKKSPYKVHSFVPVDLLPLEGEEKGDVFYDTTGEPVGNKGDYTLNKCRITTSGWLLLPTVSPELIDDVCNTTDYLHGNVDNTRRDSDAGMADTPCDEGYPVSSDCPSSPPTAPPSQVPSSQGTDEGLGSLQSTSSEDSFPVAEVEGVGLDTPMEGVMEADVSDSASVGIENIPVDDLPAAADEDLNARPVRRSSRQALRMRQLNPEEEALEENDMPREEFVALKKAIEKKNTCNLPSKLRNVNDENTSLHPASVFCARTFFSLDSKFQKSDLLSLKVTAFANNSKFINQINKYKDAIKAAKCKRKASGDFEPDEEDEIEVEGCEELKEADADGEPANPALDYDGLEILQSPTHSIAGDDPPFADEIPMGEAPQVEEIEAEPVVDIDAEFQRLAEEQMSRFRGDLQNFEQTSEVNERVRVWQKDLGPFLSDINSREKFDINLYGSRILNAFEESNRRQTIIFREFCKGMEKWEIHRYFMALLPLANIGNVSLANEPREGDEGEEDIMITLLSRKMHHLELEEFGHNSGEHS